MKKKIKKIWRSLPRNYALSLGVTTFPGTTSSTSKIKKTSENGEEITDEESNEESLLDQDEQNQDKDEMEQSSAEKRA